ncbi:MAG: hypothetical protein HOM21_16715 [Halobacteriovoraceae bacterium]|jgi:hypothetical protein|nr:hypothetical protein [Halobacteriovoraceae bacterium]
MNSKTIFCLFAAAIFVTFSAINPSFANDFDDEKGGYLDEKGGVQERPYIDRDSNREKCGCTGEAWEKTKDNRCREWRREKRPSLCRSTCCNGVGSTQEDNLLDIISHVEAKKKRCDMNGCGNCGSTNAINMEHCFKGKDPCCGPSKNSIVKKTYGQEAKS